jgi:hypothetical protein
MTSSYPGTEPAPGLVVSTLLRTAAGAALPVEVTLTNNAAAPRVLTVGALGVDAAWLPAPLRTAALDPGQSVVVTLVLTPTQGTVPASYPFAFTVQALDPATGRPAGAAAVMVDSTLVVNPRNQLTLELRPRSVSTVSSRKVRLALRNSGHEPARVTLDVKTSPRVRVRFRKKAIEVLPGATEVVRGRATVTHRRLFGGTEHHTYTVSASGTESLRHVEGSVTQHPLVGTMLMKAVALLSVLAIWIGAAVIFIPQLANRIGDRSSETSSSTTVEGDEGGGKGGDDGKGDAGGDGGSGGGSGDKGDKGGKSDKGDGGKGGTQQASDTDDSVIALTGTVAGEQPGGVQVSLKPTSLVDEDAQGGVGVGVPSTQLGNTGMSLASSFLNRALPTTPRNRTSSTSADGSWAFAGVKKPGYYLLTFTKRGFQKQSFVIDSTSEASAEPLEVDLEAGQGTLSGTVTGPRGNKVGAATVTITDGTNTITTSSNSRGQVGHWSVKGLSTPGAYVVQAVKPGYSSESRMVDLAAGGTATADLRLVSGVASLTGKVRTTNQSGGLTGVGGATVTVTDEDGKVRTATTLTQGAAVPGSKARVAADFVGTYIVPGLPAPGTYVVTLSGPGLQTQTSKVKLKPGQSRAGVDADLTSSSGAVAGTITGLASAGDSAGIVGAGLTLSNADNTYKTMSTSQPAGSFLFDGVAPGTYSLETRFFGYVGDHVTVTVKAGKTATVNRQIVQVEGGVLAARSSVQGRAIDGSTSLAVNCPLAKPECLVATVHEPGVDDDTGDDHTYTTDFLPTDEFTLPDPLTDPDGGLLPGLHKVTVSAPHYSSASASVQIGSDQTVNVGTLALLPAPKIVGTITATVGSPSGNTCIWAVPYDGASPGAAPPEDCDLTPTTGTSRECQATDATFQVGMTGRICAYTAAGTGSYTIEVPTEGTYTIYIEPQDPEYLTPSPANIVLEPGASRNQSYVLNRLGRVNLTVRKTAVSGALEPAVGTTVTLKTTVDTPPKPAVATPIPADARTAAGGLMQFVGVKPGAYTVAADEGGLKDSRPVSVGLNQEVNVRLNLTAPIPAVVGRVTSSLDGQTTNVAGATVRVTAPVKYGDDDVPTPGTVTMTTKTQAQGSPGCFIIEEAGTGNPDVTGAGGCSWTMPGPTDPPVDPSRGKITFLSNVASLVEWSAPGYITDNETQFALSTSGLNSFTLVPHDVTLGTVSPTLKPADSTFDWSSVALSVVPDAGPTNAISAKVTGTGTGTLGWVDSRTGSTPDMVIPGTYRITAKRAGYLDGSGTLVCPIPVHWPATTDVCKWDPTDVLSMEKLSSLDVTAKHDGTVVPGATYVLTRGSSTTPLQTLTGDPDGVVFTGLDPTLTDYKVSVRSAGYDFGVTTPLAIKCGDDTSVVLEAGATTVCDVKMRKLGTISGTITGKPAIPPATEPVTDLAGADVTVTECTSVVSGTCRALSATNVFTGKADDDGRFTITGTADKQGLDLDKNWLVTAVSPGYKLPDVASPVQPGTLVLGSSFDADGKATGNVEMLLKPVNASVTLLLDSTKVTGAHVELRRLTDAGTTTEWVQDAVASGTSYTFTNVVPGSYIVAYSGAGLRASTSDVLIVSAGQLISLPVARAVNVVYGTITASDGGALKDATVRVCATAACTTAAPGGDGVAMQVDTDATGYFAIRMVPDGDYWVKVMKSGYLSQTLGKFPFSPVLGPVSLNPTLQLVTRKVTVTITTPWANNDLAAAGMTASLTPEEEGMTAYTNVSLTAAGSNTFKATFEQVKWGCWTFALSKPAGHLADPGALSGGPTDSAITDCDGGDDVVVPKSDDSTAVAATLAVDEGRMDLSATLANYPGFAAAGPGAVRVTVKRGAKTWYTNPAFGVGGALTKIWLPTGGGAYTVTAEPASPSAFWPAVSVDKSVPAAQPAPDEAVAAALTLAEKAATLQVNVTGAPPSGATLTLTPPSGVTVPPGYLPTVPTGADGKVDLKLPGGSWTVTAAIPGDSKNGTKTLLAPDDYPLTIAVVWPKATGATAGAPGSFTPSTYATPANLAALSGVDASPATAWTSGQFVELGNGNNAYWDGTAWRAGKAPAPATGATAGKPGAFTPAGAALPANLAALKAAIDLGSAAAWTKDQYVVLGDDNNAYWDGTTWKAGKVP